jgi:anti-sigma factor RsiW
MQPVKVHLDENALELYCLGRATSPQLAPIERHLMQCPLCLSRAQASLEYIDSLRAALRRLEENSAEPVHQR